MTPVPPPAAALLVGGLVLPLVPTAARRWLTLLAPLVGLALLAALPQGQSWTCSFLGLPLVLARVDTLSRLFGLIFLISAFVANVYGWRRERAGEQAASLLYVGGGLIVVFAGDLITMLIGWEVMAVASAVLIFAGRRPAALAAGQRYLMVHLGGGGILLLGVLFAVHSGHDLAFNHLWGMGAASWLILAALCINAAVPPLHAWLPDAYPESSISGGVFLSAFTTKAGVYCLIRGFPGSELLVWAGVAMALYGVIFAVLENDMRRLLGYHIISQVGYMVCGVGIGTATALNGAAAHAFCHILYKGLLFMGAGAVMHATGRRRLSELGGLARAMPVSFALYMVGALSISGAPLFNGFVSKSLVITGASEDGRALVALLLTLASVGTFLHTGLKLPYFAWFGGKPARDAREAPPHMLLAMGMAAILCVAIGVAPGWLYAHLPFPPVNFQPYTAAHVFEMLLLLTFTGLAFWWLLEDLRPHKSISLDTDWFYRRPAARFVAGIAAPFARRNAQIGGRVAAAVHLLVRAARNPPAAARAWSFGLRSFDREESDFDVDRDRPPVGRTVLWVLTAAVLTAVLFVAAVAP